MKLLEFIKTKMKMSHVYQPVMIKALLENNGKMSIEEIAKIILSYDISQVEYYQSITNNMVGKILRNHEIVKKIGNFYELNDYSNLTDNEKAELIKECQSKIESYINKRGLDIWEHRRRNRHPVPGSIRFEVLKRANHRCELCGIPADEKALEVDHITPKNLGGEDSLHNYQALCYTCNSQKKDHDDTDFRNWVDKFHIREEGCVFCDIKDRKIVFENNLAYAFYDLYPVTKYHLLIIPKRHAKDYFELVQAEINAINEILNKAKTELCRIDNSISGFNIGINNGTDAGQTIFHCHVHLIPRRKGDVEYPVGGVRNVIFGKGNYIKQ